MNILHYISGLPPHRGGGSIIYAIELARTQQAAGDTVSIIYPGRITHRMSKDMSIIRHSFEDMRCYEIVNPLPIPLASGIRDIEWFTYDIGYEHYYRLLTRNHVDVLHVHSLMGLHTSLLRAARELHIRIVYTTHDYYGLCPCTVLYYNGQNCEKDDWYQRCNDCCSNAFGTLHLIADQSPIVARLYGCRLAILLIRLLSGLKTRLLCNQENGRTHSGNPNNSIDYRHLQRYFVDLLSYIDYFHFNSNQTRCVFEERLGRLRGYVIPISSPYCQDNRKVRDYGATLRVGYLGSDAEYKGLSILSSVVKSLWEEHAQIELHTCYESNASDCDYWKHDKPFHDYTGFCAEMDNIDLLVVPSVWKETFGLTVVEAISNGIPVITTDRVGARDVLDENRYGFVISAANIEMELRQILENILRDRGILREWNYNIVTSKISSEFADHADVIKKEIYE